MVLDVTDKLDAKSSDDKGSADLISVLQTLD